MLEIVNQQKGKSTMIIRLRDSRSSIFRKPVRGPRPTVTKK